MNSYEFRVRNTTNGVRAPLRIKATTLAEARAKVLEQIRDNGHPWEVDEVREIQDPTSQDLSPAPNQEVADQAQPSRLPPPREEVSSQLQKRQIELLEELLLEARVVARHGNNIVWALRGLGIGLATIFLFGVKVTFF